MLHTKQEWDEIFRLVRYSNEDKDVIIKLTDLYIQILSEYKRYKFYKERVCRELNEQHRVDV